jgi:hypothetical protein
MFYKFRIAARRQDCFFYSNHLGIIDFLAWRKSLAGRYHPGWPDEFVKKLPQILPKPRFVEINS